jgi:hypothetical protein
MLKDISINPDLLKLVENKRVVLIGPAPYLKGSNRGSEFDKADIIARPNEIIPPRHLRKDYGSRTDIFFSNFGTTWMPGIERKIALDDHEEYFKKIKLVVGSAIKSDYSETNYLSWPDDYISNIPRNFQSINSHNLKFYWIGVRDYKRLYNSIGVEFNTGIAAISILAHYPLKELHLAGFTFYHGGNSYKELYYEGHMDELDIKGSTFGLSGGHGREAHLRQVDYFKTLYSNSNGLITIDQKMKEVLSL